VWLGHDRENPEPSRELDDLSRGRLHHLRRDAKRLLVGALARLFSRGEMMAIEDVDWSIVRKVLLVRPNFRMGNLLITTTALPILRANFPRAQIDMLCPKNFKSLLNSHPDVDQIHAFSRAALFNPIRLWRLMRRIRREEYDLVIDGTMTGSAALLVRWTGGWMRLGSGPPIRHFAYTSVVPEPPRQLWRVEAMREYFRSMGLRVPRDAAMRVHLTRAEQERAQTRWQRMGHGDGDRVTGVFVGARGDKFWPAERWAELITRLWERRAPGEGLIVFHGNEEIERIETIESLIPDDVPVSYSKNLRQFAALVARCRQFISCDTGPMHLACALGVPVVSLFFRKSWTRFAPQRPQDIVVFNPDMPTVEEVLDAHRRQRVRIATLDAAAAIG
jgi:heptosyltransferase-3